MKYSAAILVALFGLAAASFLHHQDGVTDQSYVQNLINRRRHWNNDNDWNNWNNKNKNNNNNKNSNENNSNSNENNNNSNENNSNSNESNNNSNENNNRNRNQNTGLIQKQKTVLLLLSNLQGNNIDQKLVEIGRNFDPIQNINNFINQKAVIKFLKNVENNDLLPKNEVFSPTNQQHQNQAAQLFTMLYSAQDWNTLKQAAAWARIRVNTEQFVYVLSAVVLNHPSTQGVVIPALYEIIPHAFVPATTLHQLYNAKVQGKNDVTVQATYTNQNRNNNNYNKNNNNRNNNDNSDENNNTNNNNNGNNNNDDTSDENNNSNNNNNGNTNGVGTHNPNNIFADNDGSVKNNAGTSENPENRISYFTEDIGINDIHARFHLQYPVFLGANNNKNYYTSNLQNSNKANTVNNNNWDVKRGEAFYFAHQQLYARYVLERISNNLPIPHPINLQDQIETGFNPNLQHVNGQAVPVRPPKTQFQQQLVEDNNNNNNALLPNNNQAQNTKVYEQRLQQVAESGIVLNEDGTKTVLNNKNAVGILANLLAAPASSLNPDYYGDYLNTAKNAIGNIVDPNNQNGVAPGAVSNIATAARDPAYYQLLAKVNQIFKNLQNKQGPYTKDQLNFPGVKIQNVDVSNLVTQFETVTINVNNALPNNNNNRNNNGNILNNNNGNYNVRIQRLTNKPFNVRLTVLSNQNTNAIVRIFLGPKYDSNGQRFTLPQASQYFVQLDQFKVKLNNGQNVIQRNSQQSNVNVQKPATIKQLLNRIEQGQLTINKAEHQVLGLPLNSQLPKGKRNGQQFVLYTIINELNNNNNNDNNGNIVDDDLSMNTNDLSMNTNDRSMEMTNNQNVNDDVVNTNTNNNVNNQILKKVRDNRSVGFPLDRPVVDVNHNTANQYFKTVTIHHRVNNDN